MSQILDSVIHKYGIVRYVALHCGPQDVCVQWDRITAEAFLFWQMAVAELGSA